MDNLQDEKKLFFFQFKNTFFDESIASEIISLARDNQDNENDYLIFYLKMVTKALSTDGYLVTDTGAYSPASLRRTLKFYSGKSKNEEYELVDRIITSFDEAGIIKILAMNEIFIPSVTMLSRSKKEESERVENWRRRKAILDQEVAIGKMILKNDDFETILFQCFSQLVLMGYATNEEKEKYRPIIEDLFKNYRDDLIEAMFIFAKKQINLSKIHDRVNYFHCSMKNILTINIPAKKIAKSKEELIEEELENERLVRSISILEE